MVGGGGQACRLDHPVELTARDGLGAERTDRPPGVDEGGNPACHHRNRSSLGGRTSSRAEPSRNQLASSPRTTAAGSWAALPLTSSAAPAISSASATSVTWSSRPIASD